MTLERRALTDALIRSLKPSAEAYVIADTLSPLRVRVGTSAATYFVRHRWGGRDSPGNRSLGRVDLVKLAEARETAREWVKVGRLKDDPKRLEEERRRQEAEERSVTFSVVLDDYAKLWLNEEKGGVRVRRRGAQIERDLRRACLPAWRDRPLGELKRRDVANVVNEIKLRGNAAQARNVLGALKTMFSWSVEQGLLEHSPTEGIQPKRMIGKKESRDRVLTDDELFAFWRATGRSLSTRCGKKTVKSYPWGPLFRLLALTAARHSEILGARWDEIDATKRVLTVPPERFKSKTWHAIPLTELALVELENLPRWSGGDYLFSSDGGRSPCQQNGRAKDRLDLRMMRTLRALARSRGEDPEKVKLPHWVLHDLRRTVRTRLAMLRVPEAVSEAVLGHTLKGIAAVYNRHDFDDEKREALELWASQLLIIVRPGRGPTNVLRFPSKMSA